VGEVAPALTRLSGLTGLEGMPIGVALRRYGDLMDAETAITTQDEPDELILDREIEDVENDAFRHGDFVDRLLSIVKSTSTPSRIALFAAWGSGKTSIARLLKPRVEKAGHRFAYFDAFKYAREPLLREFIARLAAETLGEREADKWRNKLYESQMGVRLRGDLQKRLDGLLDAATELAKRASNKLVLLLVIAAFLIAVLVDSGSFQVSALVVVGVAVAYALLAIAQATGVLSLVGDSLRITVSRDRPDSPEQFEQVARQLVQETLHASDDHRVVVFIDELDRVEADEVVETLESLKTFLDLKGCVFIVAADRRVLEEALRLKARQETPTVPDNPYYSSAASYLDKIFQYQLALPEMLPQRLSEFALDLARKHHGIWEELDQAGRLERVISTLVPLHVQSPRRVKVLMNAFVQAYRLAEARHVARQLGKAPRERALEISKLVVLRADFPAFADRLLGDPGLIPDVIHFLDLQDRRDDESDAEEQSEEGELDQGRSEEIDRVLHEPVAAFLIKPGGSDANKQPDLARPARNALTRYLRQTRTIDGPHEDLLRLESIGAAFGLPDTVAVPLRAAAYSGDLRAAQDLVDQLEDQDRPKAVRFLAGQLQAGIGTEADNALDVLLGVCGRADVSLSEVGTNPAAEIESYTETSSLKPGHLAGVLRLGAEASNESLVRTSLAHPAALQTVELRQAALEVIERLDQRHVEALGSVVSLQLVVDTESAADRLGEIDQGLALALAKTVASELRRALDGEQAERFDEAVGGVDEEGIAAAISEAIGDLAEASEPVAEALAESLASSSNEEGQRELSEFLSEVDGVTNPDLSRAVLANTAGRPFGEFRPRLASITPDHIDLKTRRDAVAPLALSIWMRWKQTPTEMRLIRSWPK
jgi:hypothetical protein